MLIASIIVCVTFRFISPMIEQIVRHLGFTFDHFGGFLD